MIVWSLNRYFLNWFLLLSFFSLNACDPYEEVQFEIESPELGQFFPPNIPVEVKITGKQEQLNTVLIDDIVTEGVRRNNGNTLLVYKEPADGLGFVSVAQPNDPYLAVRSWLQGQFIPAQEWYPNSMVLKLGQQALNEGEGSLAHILKTSLINVDLSAFVDPISLDLGITQAQILIGSAMIRDMTLVLNVSEGIVTIKVILSPLDIMYHIESDLIRSQGTGSYQQISFDAEASLAVSGVTLVNSRMTSDRLQLNDEQIPSSIISAITDILKDRFEDAITKAIEKVTYQITGQIFSQLRPTLGIPFLNPINQQSRISSIEAEQDAISIRFETLISADTSKRSSYYSGALLSPDLITDMDHSGMGIILGSGLINQLVYAAWDAGNFDQQSYSKSQLESLGLGELSFPYSNLSHATINLLLPPILEWTADGPDLLVGGIDIDMEIDYSKDTKAWTAARVPIELFLEEGSLQVRIDWARSIDVKPIMLDRLNQIADRAEVLKLINIALPAVVNDILSQFPLISVVPFELQGLSNGPRLNIKPLLRFLDTHETHWSLQIRLQTTNSL